MGCNGLQSSTSIRIAPAPAPTPTYGGASNFMQTPPKYFQTPANVPLQMPNQNCGCGRGCNRMGMGQSPPPVYSINPEQQKQISDYYQQMCQKHQNQMMNSTPDYSQYHQTQSFPTMQPPPSQPYYVNNMYGYPNQPM